MRYEYYNNRIGKAVRSSLEADREQEMHHILAATLEAWEDAPVDALARVLFKNSSGHVLLSEYFRF